MRWKRPFKNGLPMKTSSWKSKMGVFNLLIWALICALCDATFGNQEDFTWKYNGEVNIGKKR